MEVNASPIFYEDSTSESILDNELNDIDLMKR